MLATTYKTCQSWQQLSKLATARNSCQSWQQLSKLAKFAEQIYQTNSYQTKPIMPNLPNKTYQTKPAKKKQPNQIKCSLTSLLNQSYQTQITGQSSQHLGP